MKLRREEWRVADVSRRTAVRIVEEHHYAGGGANTGVYFHGLFPAGASAPREDDCVGVAWWLPPTRAAAKATFPVNPSGVLTLTRLAIAPHVPPNGATFLLAASRRLIDRKTWPCLVTYADDWQGHTGQIYWADGWLYAGKTNPQPCYVKDGRQVSRKVGPRSRTHAEMIALGCERIGPFAKHKFVRLAA